MTSSSNLLVRQKGDAPFTKDPSVSYTMPARFYTSPDIYEIEKDAIFINHGTTPVMLLN